MTTPKRAEYASRHWKLNAIFCIILVAWMEKVSSRIRYRAVPRSDEVQYQIYFPTKRRQYNTWSNAVSFVSRFNHSLRKRKVIETRHYS